MNTSDIRRRIENQKAEHVPHAFRAGGAGMEDFNSLCPVLRRLARPGLRQWMGLIDQMRATHDGCLPCTSKILAYSVLFTRGRYPELCDRYTRLYQELNSNRQPGDRDFMAEVLDSLAGRPESPAAQAHKRNWRLLADEMARRAQTSE